MLDFLSSVNLQLFHFFNGLGSSRFLSIFAVYFSENYCIRYILLGAPYSYFWFCRKRDFFIERKLLLGMFSVVLSILIARLLADVLPFQSRPMYDQSSGFHPIFLDAHPDLEKWSSFPSDTAAVCVALPFAIFWINKKASLMLLTCSLIIFCIPRVMMGVHYPMDIIAGGTIGLFSVWICMQTPDKVYVKANKLISNIPDNLFYTIIIFYISEMSQMFTGIRLFAKGIAHIMLN